MEIYILKIYRRYKDERELAGIVQNTESGKSTPFNTIKDLEDILLRAVQKEAQSSTTRKKRKKR